MITESEEIRRSFNYNGLLVTIFQTETDDNKTWCFRITNYDENNIPDEQLFDSEDNNIFADTVEDAMDNAYEYIDNHY